MVGWQVTPVSMGDYEDCAMGAPGSNRNIAGICHARGTNPGILPAPMIYITVASLDAGMERAVALGGRTVRPPVALGTNAGFAVIADPSGAVCALFEDTRPPDEPET